MIITDICGETETSSSLAVEVDSRNFSHNVRFTQIGTPSGWAASHHSRSFA